MTFDLRSLGKLLISFLSLSWPITARLAPVSMMASSSASSVAKISTDVGATWTLVKDGFSLGELGGGVVSTADPALRTSCFLQHVVRQDVRDCVSAETLTKQSRTTP